MVSYAPSLDGHRSAASALPVFPGGGLPAPESAGRKLWIRGVAVLAITVSLGYLTWRLLFTLALTSWWVSIPFLLLETHAVLSLALFTFSLWDVDVRPPTRPVNKTAAQVAVLVPTYNESREILLPTIAAAVALEPGHETWVLDDGNRVEVAQLAKELGARYLARPEHNHAKAGNINHALGVIDADFVAILDADHVAAPDFLRNTLGYFDDAGVAVVQTPQEFYNLESFEHEGAETSAQDPDSKPVYHEQELFYRAIQPGKNRWGAAFWCGTGAVVRLAALRDVGGVATDTLTEDIHTTIRLHRRGWKTVYHNEVLARGLAATTSEQYQLQRFRWGTGAMQVLRTENPLFVPGLRLAQRIAYAATLSGWFEAWRSLGYLLLPIVVLFTGGVPVRVEPMVFALAFGLTFGLQQVALRMLNRRYHRLVLSTLFDLVRMSPNISATLSLVWPGRPQFQVTPKGRESDLRNRIEPPWLLMAIGTLSVLAAVWFSLSRAGLTPLQYQDPWFAYGACFWLALGFVMICVAIARVHSARYGPERRSSVRFATGLAGALNRSACDILEISLTGAQVSTRCELKPDLADGRERYKLAVGVPGHPLTLESVARWRRPGEDGRTLVGLEFVGGQTATQARLALALLNGQILPARRTRLQMAA